eukprot:11954955-Heterocapsa_arctica.AAC.1
MDLLEGLALLEDVRHGPHARRPGLRQLLLDGPALHLGAEIEALVETHGGIVDHALRLLHRLGEG